MEQKAESLDTGNIVWFEHINIVVGDWTLARLFYVDGLGCKIDGRRPDTPEQTTVHVNIGQQQFHLGISDRCGVKHQRITGNVSVKVWEYDDAVERLKSLTTAIDAAVAKGANGGAPSRFAILAECESHMVVCCPFGNIFVVSKSSLPAGRDGPGISSVEFLVHNGQAEQIASFYEQAFAIPKDIRLGDVSGFNVRQSGSGEDFSTDCPCAVVSVGPNQNFIFREVKDRVPDADIDDQRGVHVAVYISNFTTSFSMLHQRGLVKSNPRFLHIDSCDTLEEAVKSRQYRFYDVAPSFRADTGLSNDYGYELEHETRSMRHPSYFHPQTRDH